MFAERRSTLREATHSPSVADVVTAEDRVLLGAV